MYIPEYLHRTHNIRDGVSKVFKTHTKPYKAASKATMFRWIKTQLKECGVDMKLFTLHSTGAAATSRASQLIPLSVVMKRAAWSNASTFGRHYDNL